MSAALHLALRYLAGRPLRMALTTLAVVFGVFVFFGMNLILPSVMKSFQANVQSSWGQVDATITHKSGEPFEESLLGVVRAVPGVRVASGFFARTVNLPAAPKGDVGKNRFSPSALSLVGVDPVSAKKVRTYTLLEGRFLSKEDRGAAVITATLAHALSLPLGGDLTVPTPAGLTHFKIVGIRPGRSFPGNEEVLIPLRLAGELFSHPASLSTIEVQFDTFDEKPRLEVAKKLQGVLGDGFRQGTAAVGTELFASLKLGLFAINLFGLVSLAMGAFIIFNTFRTVVAERRRDMAMLRAIGADGPMVFSILLLEGAIQGLVGTLVGMAGGWSFAALLLKGLSHLMENLVHLNLPGPQFSPSLVGVTVVLGIGMTLLAAGIPALRALGVSPLEALRPADVGGKRSKFWVGFCLGLLLLAGGVLGTYQASALLSIGGGLCFLLGLLFMAPFLVRPLTAIFGAILSRTVARNGTGMLARGQLVRQASRSAVTASTTLLALTLLLATGSVMTSITEHFYGLMEKTFAGDYLILPPAVSIWASDVGAKPELAESIRSLPGVATVTSFRHASSSLASRRSEGGELSGDTAVSVVAIDPHEFPLVSGFRFESGAGKGAFELMAAGRNAVINGSAASTAHLHVGDVARLSTPGGLRDYRIIAVGNDYLNAKLVTAYISQKNLWEDFHKAEDVFYQIQIKPGAHRGEIESQLKDKLAPYPQFRLSTTGAYLAENHFVFYSTFGALYLLFVILAVPSLLALFNTLAIGVLERTRELGVLRAIGASRPQIRLILLGEALLLSALGATLGILAGAVLGRVLVANTVHVGFSLAYAFPFRWVGVAVLIAAVFGALAAYFPGRRAARMAIVEALRHEG